MTKTPLWETVEVRLSMWCYYSEKSAGTTFKCTCPTQAKLRASTHKRLRRLSAALKHNNYHGDWKSYLGAQNDD